MLRDDVQSWITTKLTEISDGRLPAASIDGSTRLRVDLGITSLLAVNMVLDVEDHFGIEVSDDELTHLGTVGDIVSLVLTKLSANQPGMA